MFERDANKLRQWEDMMAKGLDSDDSVELEIEVADCHF